MQMRHQARLIRDYLEKRVIDFDAIDRRQPQARQIRHAFENGLGESAELRPAFEIGAIRGEIDAGQNHFAKALRREPRGGGDDLLLWHRPRRPAPIGDDAEGAAVIAAGLHAEEGPCMILVCLRQAARRRLAVP